ncbi:hypothetical protein D3C86_1948350 [compost metagenome]
MPDPWHFDQLLIHPLRIQPLQIIKIIAPASQAIRPLGFCLTAFIQRRMIRVGVLLPQQVNDVTLGVVVLQLRGRLALGIGG